MPKLEKDWPSLLSTLHSQSENMESFTAAYELYSQKIYNNISEKQKMPKSKGVVSIKNTKKNF